MKEITADVFIEISKNSHIKYEYEKNQNILVCDRILHTPFKYQFNYGFIPSTISLDNDPVDVVVVMDDELLAGSIIKCKFIGVLETKDDEGIDPKLIMCPCAKVDPTYLNINDLTDLPEMTLKKIEYFFAHYKDLENKKVEIRDFKSRDSAIEIYKESLERHNNAVKQNEDALIYKKKANVITNYFPFIVNNKIYH
uniref:inorganic diphosphatase n=1 Tax=viral metagenome TaxID=1070528 RepID=A0A6C0EPD7_9ZZZZ